MQHRLVYHACSFGGCQFVWCDVFATFNRPTWLFSPVSFRPRKPPEILSLTTSQLCTMNYESLPTSTGVRTRRRGKRQSELHEFQPQLRELHHQALIYSKCRRSGSRPDSVLSFGSVLVWSCIPIHWQISGGYIKS